MAATSAQVKQRIELAFPQSSVALEEREGRVFGTIVWNGFKDMAVEERNAMVTRKVRVPLGLDSLNVGFLFPLAPKEKP